MGWSESRHNVGLHHSDSAFPRVSLFEEPPVLSKSAQLNFLLWAVVLWDGDQGPQNLEFCLISLSFSFVSIRGMLKSPEK